MEKEFFKFLFFLLVILGILAGGAIWIMDGLTHGGLFK